MPLDDCVCAIATRAALKTPFDARLPQVCSYYLKSLTLMLRTAGPIVHTGHCCLPVTGQRIIVLMLLIAFFAQTTSCSEFLSFSDSIGINSPSTLLGTRSVV